MKGYLFYLVVLVFVTSAPQTSNGQVADIGTKFIRTSTSSTSKIIRFFGNSFIRYNFDVLPSEMLAPTNIETMSLQFITKSTDGLMWIFKATNGLKMHISMKDSSLVFGYDDSRGTKQNVRIQHPDSRALNDFRWHGIKIAKEGRKLKFYIDEQYVTEIETELSSNMLQFVSDGEVYLGGVQNPSAETGGLVSTSFDGALTDVESSKTTGPNKELVISFLQIVEAAQKQGDIIIYEPDVWNNGTFVWDTTRAPPVTRPPDRPTPVTFTTGNSVFYLRDPLDMRNGGSLAFRFRTLEPRGLLALARGSRESVSFFAIEMFDGVLDFVYDLGSLTSRRTFTSRRLDDGEWHEVVMTVQKHSGQGGRMTLTIDGRPMVIDLSQKDIERLYFFRLYIGGYNDFARIPWPVYNRQGYKGCLDSLKINTIGVDLHQQIRSSRPQGVSIGCSAVSRFCRKQPCIRGACRDIMGGYVCDCANTQFSGDDCGNDAIIGGWDGNLATTFDFINRELTHTNDISFRFRTLMKDTILFRTEADNGQDFIRSEIVNGRAQITISVDGRTKTFTTGSDLNDYLWHTLYIRRRADDVEVWVDDENASRGMIGGENYKLMIDRIKFGAVGDTGSLKANSYIGYLQNFIYDDADLFDILKKQNSNQKWIINMPFNNLPLMTYRPVTLTTSDAYFQLPHLQMGLSMNIMFKFKTRESNGLILYNAGDRNDVIAVELSNGQIRLAYNLGGQNMFTVVPSANKLNDNKWHTVNVKLNPNGQFNLLVDKDTITVSTSGSDKRLDLSGSLYIGGLPSDMFQNYKVTSLIESRKGFRGCLASVDLNGTAPELDKKYARDRSTVLNGCTDLEMVCQPDACGTGVCMPSTDDYWCNCNMTGYTGVPCTDWPTGYYFGKNGGNGILLYEFPFEKQSNSDTDEIAFGFMTKEKDGVLYRVESSLNSKEFIEISLDDGFIKADSNTGSGLVSVSERSRVFNDGQYHVVRYIRTGTKTTLQVDSLPMQAVTHSGGASVFNKVYRVILGGRVDARGAMAGNFYGIMGGAYYNGHRWLDMALAGRALHGKQVRLQGDVVLTKPFILVSGGRKTTAAPPDIVIPANEVIPDGIGGGGFVLEGIGGAGGAPGVIGIGGPGGGLTSISGVAVAGAPVPLAVAGVGPVPPALAGGARAGAVVGTLLGTLAFMTSLMWALYKLKPGVPALLSPGAGAAGGGAGMSISAPRATSNLGAVQAASGGAGAGGAGAGATKVTVVNGSAAGGGGAGAGGGGSSTYTSYFQSSSTAVGGGGAGGAGSGSAMAAGHADAIDSSTLRATGYSSNANYQSNTMQSYGSSMGGGTMDRGYGDNRQQFMSLSSAGGGDNIPDYDMPMPGTLHSGNNYSSSTLNTHYNYQVQNYKTVTVNKQGQYMMTTAGGSVTPGAAADEVRVDCCLMTGNGGSVITGSSLGPPQVWDMQTGELQNIMKGDTIGSTNLHLVCGDRLLVGAVHADMEINEYSSRKGVFNHTLQIWDFQTGRPLSMAEGEYCSAMCPMSDSDKVLFGRTDKFGDATSIIAWDLMGNQAIKEMRYDAPVGNNDYISYLNKSKNDRYIIAGFTNSFDNNAEFMTFDMTLTSFNITEPSMLKLDANPEVTAIMPKDEAVTGLRNGDLQIWNIRTGTPSRKLMGGGGSPAHTREVKSVTLSEDSRYLVSTSADGSVKVWDMQTERPIHTLQGHSDEVWCSAISNDNEIVVSGSADGTIRLWRMKNGTEMCTFNCGVDIFYVTMSRDKGTIVALGDKYGARKLIMLQVVRTKIKKIVSS